MSRILKSSLVKVDEENKVSIKVLSKPKKDSLEPPKDLSKKSSPSPDDIINEAKKSADLILQNAQRRASIILDEARELSEKLALEAEQESRQIGYDEGYQQGVEESMHLKNEAKKTLEDAKREKEEILNSIEFEVLELIINIVNKLLTNTVYVNPKTILVLIRKGLSSATFSGDVIVRVSEEDWELVSDSKDELLQFVDASSNFEIIKDLSLNKNDCIIETPYGSIDCSLNQQYDSMIDNLYQIYNSGD